MLVGWVEELHQAPCITLRCGHTFHFHCIKALVEAGWQQSRIEFTHLECPVCRLSMVEMPGVLLGGKPSLEELILHWQERKSKNQVELPASIECLREVLQPQLQIQCNVVLKALDQTKKDDLHKDSAVMDPSGRYYKDILGHALHHCIFKLCTLCDNVFFAGAYECAPADEAESREDVKCTGCAVPHLNRVCPEHGTDYIQWKCRSDKEHCC